MTQLSLTTALYCAIAVNLQQQTLLFNLIPVPSLNSKGNINKLSFENRKRPGQVRHRKCAHVPIHSPMRSCKECLSGSISSACFRRQHIVTLSTPCCWWRLYTSARCTDDSGRPDTQTCILFLATDYTLY